MSSKNNHNNYKRNIAHNKAIKQIADELNISESVIKIIVKRFFMAVKKLLIKNEEINIKGFFSINLRTHYKKKVIKSNKSINLRRRKNIKKYK